MENNSFLCKNCGSETFNQDTYPFCSVECMIEYIEGEQDFNYEKYEDEQDILEHEGLEK